MMFPMAYQLFFCWIPERAERDAARACASGLQIVQRQQDARRAQPVHGLMRKRQEHQPHERRRVGKAHAPLYPKRLLFQPVELGKHPVHLPVDGAKILRLDVLGHCVPAVAPDREHAVDLPRQTHRRRGERLLLMPQRDLHILLLAEHPALVRGDDGAPLRADVEQLLLRAAIQFLFPQMRVEAGGSAEHFKQMQTVCVARGRTDAQEIGKDLPAQHAVHAAVQRLEVAQRAEPAVAALIETQPADDPVGPDHDGRHDGLLQRDKAEAVDAFLPCGHDGAVIGGRANGAPISCDQSMQVKIVVIFENEVVVKCDVAAVQILPQRQRHSI